MRPRVTGVVAALIAAWCPLLATAQTQAWLQLLDTSGSLKDVSRDGGVGVGIEGGALFRWTSAMGSAIELLPDTYVSDQHVFTTRISDDGSAIVSNQYDPPTGAWGASVWTETSGWAFLGGLPGGAVIDDSVSTGWGINRDGSVVVGLGWLPGALAEAFRWTPAGGMVGLGRPPDRSSRATEVSADGVVSVGFWSNPDPTVGDRVAARWVGEGPVDLFLGTQRISDALNVSADGTYIVGNVDGNAFRYDDGGGLIELGVLAPTHDRSVGSDVSDDGRRVVGWSGNPFFFIAVGYLWTAETGIQGLDEVLSAAGVDMGTWTIPMVYAISGDGQTIVGQAKDDMTGEVRGFVAFLPDGPVFGDGFESGDTTSWTVTVGGE